MYTQNERQIQLINYNKFISKVKPIIKSENYNNLQKSQQIAIYNEWFNALGNLHCKQERIDDYCYHLKSNGEFNRELIYILVQSRKGD